MAKNGCIDLKDILDEKVIITPSTSYISEGRYYKAVRIVGIML